MNRKLLAILAVAAISAAPAAASAQISTSVSLAGGIALPSGDFKSATNTFGFKPDNGYNLAAGLNVGVPLLPVGVRLEGGYNSFKHSGLSSGNSLTTNIISGTVNGTVGLGLPYIIGGVGYYSSKLDAKGTGAPNFERANALGFNGGVGIRFPLGVISTFAEIRYHKMTGNSNASAVNDVSPANLSYIPITFGINF